MITSYFLFYYSDLSIRLIIKIISGICLLYFQKLYFLMLSSKNLYTFAWMKIYFDMKAIIYFHCDKKREKAVMQAQIYKTNGNSVRDLLCCYRNCKTCHLYAALFITLFSMWHNLVIDKYYKISLWKYYSEKRIIPVRKKIVIKLEGQG